MPWHLLVGRIVLIKFGLFSFIMNIEGRFFRNPSQETRYKNARAAAMELFEKIKENLNPKSFTLEEIKDSFNALSFPPRNKPSEEPDYNEVRKIQYSKEHLKILLDEGLINESDTEPGTYFVEHDEIVADSDPYSHIRQTL